MMSRRSPRGGDSSRSATLPGGCRAIGEQLAGVRATRHLSVEDVASALMLSKSQVVGLEQADPSAFYSAGYFERALRKYMAFAGLPEAMLAEAGGDDEIHGLRLTLADKVAHPARPRAPAPSVTRPWWQAPAASIAVIAAAAGVWAYLAIGGDSDAPDTSSDIVALAPATLLPAQPISVPAVVPTPVSAVPASTAPADPVEGSTVRISVGKPTWVFVRYPDNRVVERRLEAGGELEVGPLPVYLAVGTADSVEVRVQDQPVALQPYIRNGQIRITRPELAALKDTVVRR